MGDISKGNDITARSGVSLALDGLFGIGTGGIVDISARLQYTFDGIDDLISFPDSTLEIGDSASMDLTTVISATAHDIINGVSIVNGIITAPNFSIMVDGIAYVGGVISDGAHTLKVTATVQTTFNQAGVYNGVIKNISIEHVAPTLANPDLFYPIDDGFAVNPRIRETLTAGSFPELVVNGDFVTDTDWIKDPEWTISGGKATKAAGSSGGLSQAGVALVQSRSYIVSFDLSGITGGNIKVSLGGGVESDAIVSNGAHSMVLVSGVGTTLLFNGGIAFDGSLDNVSVKETRQGTAINFNEGGWDFE